MSIGTLLVLKLVTNLLDVIIAFECIYLEIGTEASLVFFAESFGMGQLFVQHLPNLLEWINCLSKISEWSDRKSVV